MTEDFILEGNETLTVHVGIVDYGGALLGPFIYAIIIIEDNDGEYMTLRSYNNCTGLSNTSAY